MHSTDRDVWGYEMSKGNSNAAENLEPTPPLEVIDNSAQVLKPNEVEALLEEFAKKNDQEVSEPEAEADLTPEPELEASKTVLEEAQPEPLEVMEPEATLSPEPKIESGPAFTMDDVLKAASEATSFSVDEIKKFEMEPGDDDLPDPFDELDQLSSESEDEDEPESMESSLEVEASAPKRKEARAKKERAPRTKVAFSMPKIPFVGNAQVLVGPVLVAASVGAAIWFLGGKIGAVDAKLTARQDKLEKSLEETAAVLDSVSQRMADLDRSLDKSSKPTSGAKPSKAQKSLSTPKAEDSKSKAPNAASAKNSNQTGTAHIGKATKPAAKPVASAPAKKKSDPHVAEGFQVQRELLIAPTPQKPRLKSRVGSASKRRVTAPKVAAAPTNQNSVRVYLNGRLVHPKKSK